MHWAKSKSRSIGVALGWVEIEFIYDFALFINKREICSFKAPKLVTDCEKLVTDKEKTITDSEKLATDKEKTITDGEKTLADDEKTLTGREKTLTGDTVDRISLLVIWSPLSIKDKFYLEAWIFFPFIKKMNIGILKIPFESKAIISYKMKKLPKYLETSEVEWYKEYLQ